MKISNIYHRPRSEYAFALDETNYVFRLRTAPNEAKKVVFYYADRASMSELEFSHVDMPKVASDKFYDWYELRLETKLIRIAYYFELINGEERLNYFGDDCELIEHAQRADYFQLPFNHRADRLNVPEWAKNAIVYNIFPDSFATSKNFISGTGLDMNACNSDIHSKLGGTINGICENLDYIQDLGFNCIYLNPIFTANSYHKYDTLDYFDIDPCMGTKDDFRKLVNEVHNRKMRIILDGVFNHTSYEHEFFKDVLDKGKESKYYEYFYDMPDYPKFPKPGEEVEYVCFSYVPKMPKTDTSNAKLREYFCNVGRYWIKEFDIDGWRLDVANELDDGFLRDFRKACKEAKSDSIIVGEVWESANHYLQGDMMDSAMNYDFIRYLTRFVAKNLVDEKSFAANINTMHFRYKEPAMFAQLNILDSHDVSRFFSLCDGDILKMEIGILMQMTFPGMPCVFYGNELGILGISEDEYRSPMPWNSTCELTEIYKRFIKLRNDNEVLRLGSFNITKAEDGVFEYARTYKNQRMIITIDMTNKKYEIRKETI